MSDHEKPKLSSDDLDSLWREIDSAIDDNDELDINAYLAQQGHIENTQPLHADSINQHAQNLLKTTFAANEITDEQLQSKYKIIKQIDSGGQSDIYLAERSDGIYQQTVVIKFISQRFNQSVLKQQFLQEMQLLADLRHPGVVSILDGNVTQDGQPWLVLDYINGPHIDSYCEENQLTTQDVVSLMVSLCDTLQFIHKRGVLHKDIKPANVLVKTISGVAQPTLIDFGIAMSSDEEVGVNFGTRGFSSPEQVSGESVDQRSDLYSLGVLFGYLLCQSNGLSVEVCEHASLQEVLKKSGTVQDLQNVFNKLTADDPAKRYQSAEAVRTDLNQWQLGFPLSFDNHRITTVLKKTVQRHPWLTAAVIMVLGSAVFFTAKYTRDVQLLQQLTVAEKNATDELMNFMLDDLYENLERIGRIDVMQSVAEKSVAHLGTQDIQTLDQAGHFQAAKAYMNTGRVFDYLEQTDQAKEMFSAAEKQLEQASASLEDKSQYFALLAKLKVYESQVLASSNQEQGTEEALLAAIDAIQQINIGDAYYDKQTLWEARLELSYHLMEYGHAERAKDQIEKTINLVQEQLKTKALDADWLYSYSHSLQLKAWYELDFGELSQGLADTKLAIQHAESSIEQDPEDIKKQNNQRILYNQLAYFYLESDNNEAAKKAALKAIELGRQLTIKAPFNQDFEREQAYSYSTAGEVFQSEGDLTSALLYFQQGLEISQNNHLKDPNNFSAANDLAVDSLLVADLLNQSGQTVGAQTIFKEVESLMMPVHQAEPNNKYYAHALLVTKLQLEKFDEAKPLFDLVLSHDMVDGAIEKLLIKHELEWMPQKKGSS